MRADASDQDIIDYFIGQLVPPEKRIYDAHGYFLAHVTDEGDVRTWVKIEEGNVRVRHELPEGTELWDTNSERRATEAHKSWGDGAVVASLPMALLTSPDHPFAAPFREGDTKTLMRRLDDIDYRKIRTREGRLA